MIASPMTQCYSFLGAMHMPFVPIYVDITGVIDKKVKALNCMVSQQYGGRYALRRTEVNEGTYGTTTALAMPRHSCPQVQIYMTCCPYPTAISPGPTSRKSAPVSAAAHGPFRSCAKPDRRLNEI